jgi:fructokinase
VLPLRIMTGNKPVLGGVELGGTKCICIIGTGPDEIWAQASIPTGSDAAITLSRIERTLDDWQAHYGPPQALGIASFGPVNLARQSPTYGFITSTVKPGWRHTDVLGRLTARREVAVAFNTDVNAAAIAEQRWGAARGLDNFAYLTVGTGIGVGLIVRGHPVFGCNHCELGHMRVARMDGDTWPGNCTYHGDCVEGLASGPAIAERAGLPGARIADDNIVWRQAAHALAQLLHNLVLTTAPRRILVGGGVIEARPQLLIQLRRLLCESLNGYLEIDELTTDIDQYVVAPGLGRLAGPLGALALAADALAASGSASGTAWRPRLPAAP